MWVTYTCSYVLNFVLLHTVKILPDELKIVEDPSVDEDDLVVTKHLYFRMYIAVQ